MAEKADVRSLDVLGEMRTSVVMFREEATQAMSVAAAEVQRTLQWIEHDRLPYWKSEVNRRHEKLVKAKRELQQAEDMKKFGKVSSVDERKAVRRAEESLEDARRKVDSCKKAMRLIDKESTIYFGSVQGVSRVLEVDLPRAAHRLKTMGDILAEYATSSSSGGQQRKHAASVLAEGGSAGGSGTSVGTAPPAEVFNINKLRQRLIREEDRLGVESVRELEIAALRAEIDGAHLERLGLFAEEEDQPGERQRVLVDPRSAGARSIAVIRVASAGAEDSGWNVLAIGKDGPGEAGGPGEALGVAASEAANPDGAAWTIFGLPKGWGVLLDLDEDEAVTRVRGIFDSRDHVVWGTLEHS